MRGRWLQESVDAGKANRMPNQRVYNGMQMVSLKVETTNEDK